MTCVRGSTFSRKDRRGAEGIEGIGPGSPVDPDTHGNERPLTVRVDASPHVLEASEERKTIIKKDFRWPPQGRGNRSGSGIYDY